MFLYYFCKKRCKIPYDSQDKGLFFQKQVVNVLKFRVAVGDRGQKVDSQSIVEPVGAFGMLVKLL